MKKLLPRETSPCQDPVSQNYCSVYKRFVQILVCRLVGGSVILCSRSTHTWRSVIRLTSTSDAGLRPSSSRRSTWPCILRSATFCWICQDLTKLIILPQFWTDIYRIPLCSKSLWLDLQCLMKNVTLKKCSKNTSNSNSFVSTQLCCRSVSHFQANSKFQSSS